LLDDLIPRKALNPHAVDVGAAGRTPAVHEVHLDRRARLP